MSKYILPLLLATAFSAHAMELSENHDYTTTTLWGKPDSIAACCEAIGKRIEYNECFLLITYLKTGKQSAFSGSWDPSTPISLEDLEENSYHLEVISYLRKETLDFAQFILKTERERAATDEGQVRTPEQVECFRRFVASSLSQNSNNN